MTNTVATDPGANRITKLPLYNLVAKIPGPKNFAIKIFMFSFIGTQLPMFALLLYVVLHVTLTPEILTTVSIVLITASLGSASTVLALLAYTEPVSAVRKALQNFTLQDEVPQLPQGAHDDIGELMNNTQGALKKLHSMLHNMHEMSIRDELTGLYNRRFFTEQADLLLIRSARYEEPLALVYIDLDHFKDINDKFSHQVGDHALRQIGNILADSSRGSDLTARIGGDEFVIVYPNTNAAKARILGERLRQNLISHDWAALLPGQPVTVSMGVAEAVAGDTLDQLLARADQNLYKAKEGGRDQIQS
ncbi:MAG TPA: GGDEF domain-containing protein [Candidatus Acidoferrum sp.]|nr:GGDEF domain-containing protein [Candidatus Acidoferrum sp.]